jgi:hypothetical protein
MSSFDTIVRLRCYAEQKQAWEAAAEYEGMTVSAFIRHLLDRAMREYEDILELPEPAIAILGPRAAAELAAYKESPEGVALRARSRARTIKSFA